MQTFREQDNNKLNILSRYIKDKQKSPIVPSCFPVKTTFKFVTHTRVFSKVYPTVLHHFLK